jgi:cell division protein FtsB
MRKGANWREGILIGVLALSALWLGTLIWNLAGKSELAWQQAHDTKIEYQQLEARRATLQGDLDALSTPLGQDAAIREAFGVARPGEEVIVVVPPATTTATSSPGLWQDLFGWL